MTLKFRSWLGRGTKCGRVKPANGTLTMPHVIIGSPLQINNNKTSRFASTRGRFRLIKSKIPRHKYLSLVYIVLMQFCEMGIFNFIIVKSMVNEMSYPMILF
jgi:hypothetical protein